METDPGKRAKIQTELTSHVIAMRTILLGDEENEVGGRACVRACGWVGVFRFVNFMCVGGGRSGASPLHLSMVNHQMYRGSLPFLPPPPRLFCSI